MSYIFKLVISIFNKLFSRKMPESELLDESVKIMVNNKEFEVPKLNRNFAASQEVALFSYYLKLQGIDQDLRFGDFYYIKDNGTTKVRLYNKVDVDVWEDFEFQTSGKYIRMITINEAIELISLMGYEYTDAVQSIVINGNRCSIGLVNHGLQHSFAITSTNPHSMYLKAAYICLSQIKNIRECNLEMDNSDIITFVETPEDDEE